MNKKILACLIAIVLVVGGGTFFLTGYRGNRSTVPAPPQGNITFDPKNATFTIDGELVTLANGISEVPAALGSASKVTTRYFGNEATGDLNGDGMEDRAFLITRDTGGSGLFYYAVVAVKTADRYTATNAFLIGDRIAPQSTYIPINSAELQINFAERKRGEPMTVPPSVGATLLLKVTPEGVLEGLMK